MLVAAAAAAKVVAAANAVKVLVVNAAVKEVHVRYETHVCRSSP